MSDLWWWWWLFCLFICWGQWVEEFCNLLCIKITPRIHFPLCLLFLSSVFSWSSSFEEILSLFSIWFDCPVCPVAAKSSRWGHSDKDEEEEAEVFDKKCIGESRTEEQVFSSSLDLDFDSIYLLRFTSPRLGDIAHSRNLSLSRLSKPYQRVYQLGSSPLRALLKGSDVRSVVHGSLCVSVPSRLVSLSFSFHHHWYDLYFFYFFFFFKRFPIFSLCCRFGRLGWIYNVYFALAVVQQQQQHLRVDDDY